MITTEQEARAAVESSGPDVVRVVNILIDAGLGFCPYTIRIACLIFDAIGKPRKSAQLHRFYAEWAAARGAAK